MALESGTYISDLVATNPVGSTDTVSTLDGHVQLLKSTIKATFPNVSGAVTPTHTELNYVDGVTSAIQTQLDAKAPTASPTFTGTVLAGAVTLSGGAVSMSGATSVTVPTPSTSTHAATKAYVDAAVGTGAGSWTLLKSTAASAVATVDFVNGSGGVVIDSTYDEYMVAIIAASPVTDAANFRMLTSTNAGSSYDGGAANYVGVQTFLRSGAANPSSSALSSNSFDLTSYDVGNAAGEQGVYGVVRFYSPSAAAKMHITGETVYTDETGTMCMHSTWGVRATAADVDAIRFLFSTGNIASGTFNLYARKKS